MAGDLFIENISCNHFNFLTDAHGTEVKDIYHADRDWRTYENVLRTRLASGLPANRVQLPAHCYVTFKATNRTETSTYVSSSPINKARLGNVLEKVSRPLGLVAANPNLNNWNGLPALARVDMLIAALGRGSVTIEYYKYEGSPVAICHTGWAKHNE